MSSTPGVTAEDAAVFGYGLVAARAEGAGARLARERLAEHRARRDAAQELWPDAPAAPTGYTGAAPETGAQAAELGLRLERDCAVAWRAQLQLSEDQSLRRACVDALTAAAVGARRWRELVPGAGSDALPGLDPAGGGG